MLGACTPLLSSEQPVKVGAPPPPQCAPDLRSTDLRSRRGCSHSRLASACSCAAPSPGTPLVRSTGWGTLCLPGRFLLWSPQWFGGPRGGDGRSWVFWHSASFQAKLAPFSAWSLGARKEISDVAKWASLLGRATARVSVPSQPPSAFHLVGTCFRNM